MNNAVEAASLIRRANFVPAHEMVSNEYGVEYSHPAQREYCFFKPKSVLRKGLKNAAESFGCLTYMVDDYWLAIVGEEIAIDNIEKVRCVVLSDEYGYGQSLKTALQQVDIPIEQLKKWLDDYILGFIEGVAGHIELGWFGMVSKNPRVLGILDGASSARRYVEEKEKENKQCW